jgi:glycosyltransferase involved in cell wall biosynthesis
MKPKFSIAIPAYNRRDYLRQAIRSSLAQTVHDFEVIVADDCSTEELKSVVDSFSDPRVKYHRSAARLGAARNHQLSVDLSEGEYVVNLHSDDLLLPAYLKVAGGELDRCREAAAVYSSVAYLKDSKVTGCQRVPRIRFADRNVYSQNSWLEKFHNVVPTSCMFRRSTFLKIGGYRLSLRFAYDWDLFIRLMTIGGGVVFSPDVLSIYRQHEEQAAQTNSEQGFYDVLDLWQFDEYSHWPLGEIADLTLTVLRGGMKGNKWIKVVEHIRHRGLTLRLLRGLPSAFRRRWGRARRGNAENDNYEYPANMETALCAARALVENSSAMSSR